MADTNKTFEVTWLAFWARLQARKLVKCIWAMLGSLKVGEAIQNAYERARAERDSFLNDNERTQVDENAERNTDNKRARRLLWATFGFESILSFKGLQYLSDHFTGVSSWLVVLPAGLIFAAFAIWGGITVNHFARGFMSENPLLGMFLVATSYAMILIIPACNLMEAYESNGGPGGSSFAIALNWILCAITVVFHASLISMSSVFITAENSKQARRALATKEANLSAAERRIRGYELQFMNQKKTATAVGAQFVSTFNRLKSIAPAAAQNVLYECDNFSIWILNNKLMLNEMIPYHANENGQPVVASHPFTSDQGSLMRLWDELSSLTRRVNRNNEAIGPEESATVVEEPPPTPPAIAPGTAETPDYEQSGTRDTDQAFDSIHVNPNDKSI